MQHDGGHGASRSRQNSDGVRRRSRTGVQGEWALYFYFICFLVCGYFVFLSTTFTLWPLLETVYVASVIVSYLHGTGYGIFHFTAVFLQVSGRILCGNVFTAQMLFCKCLGLFPGMSMRRGCVVSGVRGERVVAAKRQAGVGAVTGSDSVTSSVEEESPRLDVGNVKDGGSACFG